MNSNKNDVVKVYKNKGNIPLFEMLHLKKNMAVLDVGCGAGDNARLIRDSISSVKIDGITYSEEEKKIAKDVFNEIYTFNIEDPLPSSFPPSKYDIIIFSHILEHCKYPTDVVRRFLRFLNPDGRIIVAVPNILNWRMRFQFMIGNFEYVESGVLDDTHVRFFTYITSDRYIFSGIKELKVINKSASGSVPLWILRRYVLPKYISRKIDAYMVRRFPNLFGEQVLIELTLI
ncbi:class I SAM-dependent methyltransferase [Polynucleobacter paneuropaeus]|nr:class I SAM-dependent methyltransferase [Polynucleobacter paneuropaeus]